MTLLFYDGECGLCHALVRFVLRHDKGGKFSFAPLQGETFWSGSDPVDPPSTYQTMVVRAPSGEVYIRSEALIFVLRELGGIWALFATILSLFPGAIRDVGYSFISRVRRSLFPHPEALCPVLPTELRSRFLK